MKTSKQVLASGLLAAVTLLGAALPASAMPVLYGVTGAGGGGVVATPSSLYTIDPLSGGTTLIGSTGFTDITGIDFDPLTGTLYGVQSGLFIGTGTSLITINTTTGVGTSLGSTGNQIPDVTIGPDGVLRGWRESDGTTSDDDPIVIDKGTGAVTVTSSGLNTFATGVASLDATNIYVKPGGELYSVDVGTGASTFLFSFDFLSNLLENMPTGDLISGQRTGGGTQFYSIDTGTGATTALGFSSGVAFSAIAYSEAASVPEPTTVVLLGGALFGFGFLGRRRRR